MQHIEPDRHTMKRHTGTRPDDAGLVPLVRVMLEGLRPLRPLAAQLLWIGQPVLAMFERGDLADEWAALLDGPKAGEGDREESA